MIRVAEFPSRLQGNPYQRRLREALGRRGCEFVDAGRFRAVALVRRRDVDVVHLHWLEYVATPPARAGLRGTCRMALRVVRVAAGLRLLRVAGVRVVWTVHNLQPHEPTFPRLYRLLARQTVRAAHAVVVHSAHAGEVVRSELGTPRRLVVAHHSNYVDAYPEPDRALREEGRAALGVGEEERVFLCFGRVRAYKRLEEVVAAFAGLDRPDARLVIAGAAGEDELRERLEELAGRDPRVVLELGYADERAASRLHAAADAAVFNYREVFSSGALLLALSMGLPVVAPPGGSVTEIVPPEALVPIEDGDLRSALEAALTRDLPAAGAAARAAAGRFTWDSMAAAVLAAYDDAREEQQMQMAGSALETVN